MSYSTSVVAPSFYRRPLPEGLVPFSSIEGKQLFREALSAGTMEGYFVLSEQFHTQADPAYCGLGSLVVALNALGVDPGRLWKGPWRWFDESLLDCCVPLDVVATRGVTLPELGCLAECNGAHATVVRAQTVSVADLRRTIAEASRSASPIVIAAYDRAALGQTGIGHFSPVGGYHEGRDLTLLLDVARFKYPPHWVPIERLFEAMLPLDSATGQSRGWVSLTANTVPRPMFLRLSAPAAGWRSLLGEIEAEASRNGLMESAEWAAAIVRRSQTIAEVAAPLSEALQSEIAPEHRAYIEQVLAEVRTTPAYDEARAALAGTSSSELTAEVVAILVLVLAPHPRLESLPQMLGAEVSTLRRQVGALCAAPTQCSTG
jgi:glutathione gamma-glutamylcysteinyltransferase